MKEAEAPTAEAAARSAPGTTGAVRATGLRRALLVAGVALLGTLILHFGPARFAALLARMGPRGLGLLVFPVAAVQASLWLGLWLCIDPAASRRVSAPRVLLPHLVGEALNTVTLLAQMGGEPVKAQLLRPLVGGREAVAAVVVARTLRVLALLLFLSAGVALALASRPTNPSALRALAVGVLGLGALGFALLAGQQRGLFGALARALGRFGFRFGDAAARLDRIDTTLRRRYREQKARLLASFGVQLASFFLGALEVAIAARWLGQPLGAQRALAVESVGLAISTLFFVVPGGLGVSEGGRAAAFALFGLDPAVGLAVGLVRRGRDLAWAALGLALYAGQGRRRRERR